MGCVPIWLRWASALWTLPWLRRYGRGPGRCTGAQHDREGRAALWPRGSQCCAAVPWIIKLKWVSSIWLHVVTLTAAISALNRGVILHLNAGCFVFGFRKFVFDKRGQSFYQRGKFVFLTILLYLRVWSQLLSGCISFSSLMQCKNVKLYDSWFLCELIVSL